MNGLLVYLICFIVAFFISTTQYGQDKFQNNFWSLYKSSYCFYIYGLLYGGLAILIYYFLNENNTVNPSNLFEKLLLAVSIGFCFKGVLDINFINISNIKFGPKIIADFIEKLLHPHINDDFSIRGIKIFDKALDNELKDIEIPNLLTELKRYLPWDISNIDRTAFEYEILQFNDKELIIRYFSRNFGFRLLNQYLKSKH